MKKIPKSISDHTMNANYYIEASKMISYPNYQAVRLLLLLTAWENIQIAEEEFDACVHKTPIFKDLYKSHAYKFKKAPPIPAIKSSQKGTKTLNTFYKTAEDFEKLISICRYGFKSGEKNLNLIFKNGWFLEHFEKTIIKKIKFQENAIQIFNDSLKNKTR